MTAVRTRFAPSPTGFLHVGGARTALFAWAYARRHGGTFVLRIEDTDLERSTEASVQAILDGLRWLGLDWDEGPFFQMQRLARYREIADHLIAQGQAYPCWATREELDALRERQRAAGEKPRYDGRWRPERAKAAGLVPPADRLPVIRFRNPDDGAVSFDDLIKGTITVANAELDDLVLMRADGVPTYNFGVVVDDLDMAITHVIRGDDHVNNTPRQVNIFRALGGADAALPEFAHVPMILGADGERLSKRHGAVSVTQYRESGFLPEALLNYLSRLGWSHGNEEIFTRDQFVAWFDLEHVARSPAQFDPEKLTWLNQQYVKSAPSERLAALTRAELLRLGVETAAGPDLERVVSLLKDRTPTIPQLAEAASLFYREPRPTLPMLAEHLTPAIRPALHMLQAKLSGLAGWDKALISGAVKETLVTAGVKMPVLAMPLRVILTGQTQTPSIDAVLELLGRERVLARLAHQLDSD